jgi:short-subunit dehydrogenase
VIVTGGSGGIGQAVVAALGRKGARVGLIGRDVERLCGALARTPTQSAFAVADVRRRGEVREAVRNLALRLGSPHALVVAHGRGAFGPFSRAEPGLMEEIMAVNFLGACYAVEAVLPFLEEQGEGAIVLVGSVAGRSAAPLEALYSASKFALSGFADALAVELEAKGIAVSLVQPGPVTTEFFARRGAPYHLAWPRPVSPVAVAQAVVQSLERGTHEVFVPPSLGLAVRLGTWLPALRRRGVRRLYRRLGHSSRS